MKRLLTSSGLLCSSARLRPAVARVARLGLSSAFGAPPWSVANCRLSAMGALAVGVAGAAGWQVSCEPGKDDCSKKADALFDANDYATLARYLRDELVRRPDDAELLWRLGRALKKMADAESDKSKREALTREGLSLAESAVTNDNSCGPAHKWYAILLSGIGEFTGTSAKIKNTFVVREHFESAVALSPDDATSRHLLGVWCFEVAKLSWIEKKAAAALFATPPTATFEEAVLHFELAEAQGPGFYPKNQLLLAQALAKLGKKAEAQAWLDKCLASTPKTPEDEQTLKDAANIKL